MNRRSFWASGDGWEKECLFSQQLDSEAAFCYYWNKSSIMGKAANEQEEPGQSKPGQGDEETHTDLSAGTAAAGQ
jgi:hypothetical protein